MQTNSLLEEKEKFFSPLDSEVTKQVIEYLERLRFVFLLEKLKQKNTDFDDFEDHDHDHQRIMKNLELERKSNSNSNMLDFRNMGVSVENKLDHHLTKPIENENQLNVEIENEVQTMYPFEDDLSSSQKDTNQGQLSLREKERLKTCDTMKIQNAFEEIDYQDSECTQLYNKQERIQELQNKNKNKNK